MTDEVITIKHKVVTCTSMIVESGGGTFERGMQSTVVTPPSRSSDASY